METRGCPQMLASLRLIGRAGGCTRGLWTGWRLQPRDLSPGRLREHQGPQRLPWARARTPACPQFCPMPPWRHRAHSLMLAFMAAALGTEGDCHPRRDPLCVLATGTRCGTALKVTRDGAWNGRIYDNIFWIAVRLCQDLSKISG